MTEQDKLVLALQKTGWHLEKIKEIFGQFPSEISLFIHFPQLRDGDILLSQSSSFEKMVHDMRVHNTLNNSPFNAKFSDQEIQ